MTKQLRKVFSILCAIALLLSSMATALAEETAPAEEAAAQAAVEETVVEASAAEAPAVEAPAVAEPAPAAPIAEEPAVVEPAPEAPKAEEPAAAEPAPAAPKAEEPAVVEPAPEAPKAEEPAAEEPAAEEPADEEPAAEEPAVEESASDNEETDDEEDDGLVELDDGWGYIDQEVIEENTPEITDELKGIRTAELTVGEVLAETIDFGEELVITLKDSGASTVGLKLYVPSGASINTKVDGKAVGFTPAESDIPSMDLYTYELANAAGRSHDIVLSSYDTVSFVLSAVVNQAETVEMPVTEENAPAETPAGDTPAGETPAETPVPTIQVSVKTYDALKVGNSISDTLIAGQKAKIQVKCGKHLNVVLTLNANPDDAVVTIDGTEAQFVPAGNGTYTCELNDVAFRKFNVVISAKQELDFTLSAAAGEAAEEVPAEEETVTVEEPAEEINEDINNEETAEEVTEETSEETSEEPSEEKTEETAEEAAEEPSEGKTEETTEEAAEESAEEAAEASSEEVTGEENEEAETPEENEGEKAEDEEENTEEETVEETEEQPEETEEAEALIADQMTEQGYRKIRVENKNGADIYDSTEEEAAVIGHADFESELWIKDAEAEGWAEIYTEKKQEAAVEETTEAAAEETAEEATEEATEVAAEEDTKQFIRLAEIEKQPVAEEDIEALGYRKVQILNKNGADIYDNTEDEAEAIGHADFESELWIKDLEEVEGWAEIFSEEGTQKFVKLAEIEEQMPSDEEMLAMGYIKVFVAYDIGANVYDDPIAAKEGEEEEEPVEHLDAGTVLWVKLIDGADRALIFDMDEEAPARYINLVDIIATMKPEEMEELPTRELVLTSSIAGQKRIVSGTPVTLSAELVNFMEDDHIAIQWKYSVDGEEFIDIEGANELTYEYKINKENFHYIWRISITLISAE